MGGVLALGDGSPLTIAAAGAGSASASESAVSGISRRLSIAPFLACVLAEDKPCRGLALRVSGGS